jgi:hypothetical protein
MPAAIASQTFRYRSPSQPQTAGASRSHRTGSALHVPEPSALAQCEVGNSQ